jgi:hypothetical protein
MREDYAKIALLMFHPLQKLDDIMMDGSYWKLFYRDLRKFKRNEMTTMWKKGFEILENIENRPVLQRGTPND